MRRVIVPFPPFEGPIKPEYVSRLDHVIEERFAAGIEIIALDRRGDPIIPPDWLDRVRRPA